MYNNLLNPVSVRQYKLTVDGLWMLYTYQGKTINATIEPRPLVAMMKQLGLIEGVEYDKNGEPVILFEKDCDDGEGNWQSVIGHCEWALFAGTYPLQEYEVAALAELNEGYKSLDFFQDCLKSMGVTVQTN